MPRLPRALPWIVLALLLLLVAGVLIGGSVWVQRFLRSESFRQLVAEKTGVALQSQATYAPLTWTGDSVFSDQLTATGLPGSPVVTLKADQIRAEVNWRAIMQGVWRVDEINSAYVAATFQQRAAAPQPAAAPTPAPPPSGLWKWLPSRFELGRLNIAQSKLSLSDAAGHSVMSLRDCALTLRPDGDEWVISGERGTLAAPSLPELTVDTFSSRLQQSSFFLTDARLRLGEGKISLSGEFEEKSRLLVEWQQIDVTNFLDDVWKGRLSGIVSGNSTIEWGDTGWKAASATGHFELTDGLLQNLPLLEQISTFTGAPQFRRMPLQKFSGDYSWSADHLTVTNLIAESNGLMRLEGSCQITPGGGIEGAMRLGVTPQTLQWLPGSRERVFTVAENGYLWTDVRISGNLQDIREDLSARLVKALENDTIQRGANILDEVVPGAGGEAKKALELLTPLVR